MIEEIWKDIKEYEGMYQCSNLGNIKTLDRYIKEKSGKLQFKKGIPIKQRLNKNGYLQFGLNKNATRKMVYTHIIIANTFLENLSNFEVVNHKDGNKLNNKIDNLEFCTYSLNNKHAYTELNRNISDYGASKVHVYIIDTIDKSLKYYETITETSKNINLSHTQINRYLDKKNGKEDFCFYPIEINV